MIYKKLPASQGVKIRVQFWPGESNGGILTLRTPPVSRKKSIYHYSCHSFLGCCLWFSVFYQTQSGLHCLVCKTCTNGAATSFLPVSLSCLCVPVSQPFNTPWAQFFTSAGLIKPFSPETVLPLNLCQQASSSIPHVRSLNPWMEVTSPFLSQGNHHLAHLWLTCGCISPLAGTLCSWRGDQPHGAWQFPGHLWYRNLRATVVMVAEAPHHTPRSPHLVPAAAVHFECLSQALSQAWHISPHFILTGLLWYRCYYPHFTNKETMA